MVHEAGSRFGFIGGSARSKLHSNRDYSHLSRQINAIKRIGEYLRAYSEGTQEPRLWELINHYLKVLSRFQKITIGTPLTEEKVTQWLASEAADLLRKLREDIRKTETSISSRYREAEHTQFLNVSERSKWLTSVGLGKHVEPPPRWISHPTTEQIIKDPKKIKELYLKSGAPLLQKKRELGTETGGSPRTPEPPRIRDRIFVGEEQKIHNLKPTWWDRMYDRKAKNISMDMWSRLMGDVTFSEMAPGCDGVSSDLIKLLTLSEGSSILETLVDLINAAIRKGESWRSWRKSIISMIPKKKPDGSYTSKVEDMRPISVMQEFAKITSKILANRLGNVLLDSPHILNSELFCEMAVSTNAFRLRLTCSRISENGGSWTP